MNVAADRRRTGQPRPENNHSRRDGNSQRRFHPMSPLGYKRRFDAK